MLDGDELQRILDQVEYRPDWKFLLRHDPYEGPYLRIIAPVENSYRSQRLDLGVNTYLSPNDRADEQAFLRFLLWRLIRIESHEAREFLRRKGRAIFDPHIDDD